MRDNRRPFIYIHGLIRSWDYEFAHKTIYDSVTIAYLKGADLILFHVDLSIIIIRVVDMFDHVKFIIFDKFDGFVQYVVVEYRYGIKVFR